jgi:hypothetical protein
MKTKSYLSFTGVLAVILGVLFVLSLASFLYGTYLAGDSAGWQMIINAMILSIPLALLYFSIGVLVVAARQKYAEGQIQPRLARLIYWSPRGAGILIIFFVSLFALDVFGEGYTIGKMLLGFLMHMLPSIALAIVLALAWRWEWVGLVTFLGAAAFFLVISMGDSMYTIGNLFLFVAPMLVIALLFGANWRWHKELHPTPRPLES